MSDMALNAWVDHYSEQELDDLDNLLNAQAGIQLNRPARDLILASLVKSLLNGANVYGTRIIKCPYCDQIDFRSADAYSAAEHFAEGENVGWTGDMPTRCLACGNKFVIKRTSLWTVTKE